MLGLNQGVGSVILRLASASSMASYSARGSPNIASPAAMVMIWGLGRFFEVSGNLILSRFNETDAPIGYDIGKCRTEKRRESIMTQRPDSFLVLRAMLNSLVKCAQRFPT